MSEGLSLRPVHLGPVTCLAPEGVPSRHVQGLSLDVSYAAGGCWALPPSCFDHHSASRRSKFSCSWATYIERSLSRVDSCASSSAPACSRCSRRCSRTSNSASSCASRRLRAASRSSSSFARVDVRQPCERVLRLRLTLLRLALQLLHAGAQLRRARRELQVALIELARTRGEPLVAAVGAADFRFVLRQHLLAGLEL